MTLTRALPADRIRDLALLAGLLLWLLYTRVFWVLRVVHVTAPPCPFYYLTGHPCPFCGGTRSFAYMWQGDLADSVRLYPLGPALFAGTVAAVGGLSFSAVTGRTWTARLNRDHWRLLGVAVGIPVAISWALKVFVLGN